MEKILLDHPWIIILVLAWVLPWKAVALWQSARKSQIGWFLSVLILNTLGILEIIYILFFNKKEIEKKPSSDPASESKFKRNRHNEGERMMTVRKYVV